MIQNRLIWLLILTRTENHIQNLIYIHIECSLSSMFPKVKSHLTSTKYMSALVASCSKIVVVAISTVELVVCCCKWLVNQRSLAVRAFEALLVPMCIFVRQILRTIHQQKNLSVKHTSLKHHPDNNRCVIIATISTIIQSIIVRL